MDYLFILKKGNYAIQDNIDVLGRHYVSEISQL